MSGITNTTKSVFRVIIPLTMDWMIECSGTVTRMCSLLKKVLLKSLQNTKENTYAGVSFLTTLQAWGKFLKPPSSSGCFLMLDFVFGVVGRTSKYKTILHCLLFI